MRLLILTVLIWMSIGLSASAQTLTSVSYTETDVILGFSSPVKANVFTIGDGKPRIVIDILKGQVNLGGKTLENGPESLDGEGGIKRVRLASRDEGLRLVLDLQNEVKLKSHKVADNRVLVTVDHKNEDKKTLGKQSLKPRFFENTVPYPRLQPILAASLKPRRKPVIVIDPGHGGRDPGAIGIKGTQEKDITTAAAKELQRQLQATGRYKIMMTRTADVYVEHEERLRIARAGGADLFISIHADSAGNKTARGASVYTLADRAKNRSKRIVNDQNWIMDVDLTQQTDPVGDILVDLAQRNTETQSEQFADVLIENLGGSTQLIGNSHRRAGYFVLLAPDVPAVLLELGFLSNRNDEQLLNSKAHRKKVLRSVTRSINSYFDEVER